MSAQSWHFEKQISIGNIATIVILLLSAISAYFTLVERASASEQIIRITQAEVTAIRGDYIRGDYVSKEMYQLQQDRLSRIEQKLDRLIELQLKAATN